MLDYKKLLKNNPFVLAPMLGVTDVPFRLLCEKYSASFTFSEMISADAIVRGLPVPSKKGLDIVQLFGNTKSPFRDAISLLDCSGIDINLGCPSPRTLSFSAGCSLLKSPSRLSCIFEKITDCSLPISAKIRLGYSKANYLKVAKILEDCGVSLLTLHGRLCTQGYSGKADWYSVSKLSSSLEIPVIGNGDITSVSQISFLDKCSGLMIGRAAIGNPQIFSEFYSFWAKKEFHKKTKRELFSEYLSFSPKKDFLQIRQQALFFTKGEKGSKSLRSRLSSAQNINEIQNLLSV